MAKAPAVWPAESRLTRDPARYTLLAFAHPRCPCVRATLEELREIEARYSERVRVVVISCAPPEGASDGFQALMADIARTAPRTEIFQDLDQAEALRFGARTSGTIMLFRPDGRLAFDGGITAGRGHVGPNPGAANVIHALEVGDSGTRAPVFGCPLGIVREGQ